MSLSKLPSRASSSSRLLSRNISVRYTRTSCVRSGPLLVAPTACVSSPTLRNGFGNIRHYANPPGGGIPGGGFPGFSLGQQPQKGDALKDYVR